MKELTATARNRLDQYLAELRAALGGCPSVDRVDVERDVMHHIEKSLSDAPAPVDLPSLGTVLEQLGKPSQWLPEEDLSWVRQQIARVRTAVAHLRSGPEDFRLAYLSIGTLGVATFLMVIQADPETAMCCVAFSFLFARAALAMASSPDEMGAQRWLVYPSLVAVYLPLSAALLVRPATIPVGLADGVRGYVVNLGRAGQFPLWAAVSYGIIAGTSLWWSLLGLVAWRRPAWVSGLFHPLASGFRGKHALWFGAGSLLVFLATAAVGGYVTWNPGF